MSSSVRLPASCSVGPSYHLELGFNAREAWRNWSCKCLNIYMCVGVYIYMYFRLQWGELVISWELSSLLETEDDLQIIGLRICRLWAILTGIYYKKNLLQLLFSPGSSLLLFSYYHLSYLLFFNSIHFMCRCHYSPVLPPEWPGLYIPPYITVVQTLETLEILPESLISYFLGLSPGWALSYTRLLWFMHWTRRWKEKRKL